MAYAYLPALGNFNPMMLWGVVHLLRQPMDSRKVQHINFHMSFQVDDALAGNGRFVVGPLWGYTRQRQHCRHVALSSNR